MKMMRKNSNSLPTDAEVEKELNRNLSNEWKEKAELEVGETDSIVDISCRQLRNLLAVKQSHHTNNNKNNDDGNNHDLNKNGFSWNQRNDDAFLLRFLRAKKFDVDKAFKMLEKYFAMKHQSSEIFKVAPIGDMKSMLEMNIQTMMPLKDNHGRQIYIFRVEKCDPYKVPVDYVFRSNILALEDAIRFPETQIGGLSVLLDMAGVGFAHARYLSPNLAKKTVEVVQESFPMRFKAFHVLHEPFYFDAILTVLKPFLKDKIRRRIYLHGNDLQSLHKHIPKECLPQEYGGLQPPFDNRIWRESIFEDEDYFERLETFGCESAPIAPDDRASIAVSEEFDFMDDDTDDSEFDANAMVLSPRRRRPVESIETLLIRRGVDEHRLQEVAVNGVVGH